LGNPPKLFKAFKAKVEDQFLYREKCCLVDTGHGSMFETQALSQTILWSNTRFKNASFGTTGSFQHLFPKINRKLNEMLR
jgi:hypothetical protein